MPHFNTDGEPKVAGGSGTAAVTKPINVLKVERLTIMPVTRSDTPVATSEEVVNSEHLIRYLTTATNTVDVTLVEVVPAT